LPRIIADPTGKRKDDLLPVVPQVKFFPFYQCEGMGQFFRAAHSIRDETCTDFTAHFRFLYDAVVFLYSSIDEILEICKITERSEGQSQGIGNSFVNTPIPRKLCLLICRRIIGKCELWGGIGYDNCAE